MFGSFPIWAIATGHSRPTNRPVVDEGRANVCPLRRRLARCSIGPDHAVQGFTVDIDWPHVDVIPTHTFASDLGSCTTSISFREVESLDASSLACPASGTERSVLCLD